MKGKKKGVSSILGALIFLQILLISLVLIIHVTSNETNLTQISIQRFQALSENAPIGEELDNNVTFLYSTTQFVITHVIYPNGKIVNPSIVVNSKFPVSQILNGYPWAIIVTSKGTWYNVTLLGDSNNELGQITFPNYHDYGIPIGALYALDPSIVKNEHVSFYSTLLSIMEPQTSPCWSIIDGIIPSTNMYYLDFFGQPQFAPSGICPMDIPIGGTTYSSALAGDVLVAYPLSSSGWINITYYGPNNYQYLPNGAYPPAPPDLGIYIPFYNNNNYYYLYGYINGPGIYNTFPYLEINYNTLNLAPITGKTVYISSALPSKTDAYQIDINLYKGEMLSYMYNSSGSTWQLYQVVHLNQGYPLVQMYPIYIVVPPQVYLLQVSLS